MKVLTVIGNRPQFIKAAAVSPRLRAVAQEVLVHTGQHFDDALSAVFFSELGLPAPEVSLGVSGGSNTSQTARMLAALEPVVSGAGCDLVLVYGDTNSTLAGALVAAQAGIPVAHVEAGMRSFDRSMPEEVNRVLTDHLSSLLLCSSEEAVTNLRREGVVGSVCVVGDVMVDVALALAPRARARLDLVEGRGVAPGSYVLATAHRAGNVDTVGRLSALVDLLAGVAEHLPVILPLHPRTRARLDEFGLMGRLVGAGAGSGEGGAAGGTAGEDGAGGVRVIEPVGYLEMAALLGHARAALTDSGGLQKEAYLAGVPCITLRPSTEWVETVQSGWNVLVDLDLGAARRALEAFATALPAERPELYGDGMAGERVASALIAHVEAARRL